MVKKNMKKVKITEKIVNLTPHAINLCVGSKSMEIPPSGIIARCEESIEDTLSANLSNPFHIRLHL